MSSVVLGTHLVLRGDGTISIALDEDVHILKEDAYEALIDGIGQLKVENAKLRDALKALMMGTNAELCAYRDEPDCRECSMHHGKDGCAMVNAMELLGIDMFGEPLGVEL